MEVIGWFQKTNFISEELGKLSCEDAINYISKVDWDECRTDFNLKLDEDPEVAPPGFGLNSDSGSLFHLYIQEAGWHLLLGIRDAGKFLGFIPKPIHQTTYKVANLNHIDEVVNAFYNSDRDEIFRTAQRHYEEI